MLDSTVFKTLKILYVEDEDITRNKLGKILRRTFDTVITAGNGEEGYNEFEYAFKKNIAFDFILSDINMPIMNGLDMLEKIRVKDKFVPFIFTTARSEIDQISKAIELEANDYILKPIEPSDILNRISKVYIKTHKNDEHIDVISKIDKNGNIIYNTEKEVAKY